MLLYIIITLLMLSVLILVHEFGHFLAARLCHVRVEEFSIGMGPALYQREGRETLFSIRAFPIGGYCSLQGENDVEPTEPVELLDGSYVEIPIEGNEEINPEESFINKKPWQRFIILIAGVTMNFILAILIIYLALILTGNNPITALGKSFTVFFQLISLVFLSLKMLFTGEAGLNDLTGPVGIVHVVEEYYSYGFIYLLLFTAMLSANLGILNLLPIPALDGGQILILLVEKIKRSPISEQFKTAMFNISYALLLGLGIFLAFNDFSRFFT